MKYIITIALLLSVISTQAQTYLSDLEWAADSTYLIGTRPTGEPYYFSMDSLKGRVQAATINNDNLDLLMYDGTTLSINLTQALVDQSLTIDNRYLVGGDSIMMSVDTSAGGTQADELIFTDQSGNAYKVHYKTPTVPLVDNQQLSISGNTITLTNGGSVTVKGYVDSVYASGNQLMILKDGQTSSITLASCDFCDPLTIAPYNAVSITEGQLLSSVVTRTSLNTTSVVPTNTSDCSDLIGHMYARAKIEIYGHQMAEYIAYIEYRKDGGSWTKIDESEKEIYRNAGNYEEDFDLYGQLPVTVASSDSDTYEIRAKIEVVDVGSGSLFLIGDDDEGTATWRTTTLRLDFLLSNTSN